MISWPLCPGPGLTGQAPFTSTLPVPSFLPSPLWPCGHFTVTMALLIILGKRGIFTSDERVHCLRYCGVPSLLWSAFACKGLQTPWRMLQSVPFYFGLALGLPPLPTPKPSEALRSCPAFKCCGSVTTKSSSSLWKPCRTFDF